MASQMDYEGVEKFLAALRRVPKKMVEQDRNWVRKGASGERKFLLQRSFYLVAAEEDDELPEGKDELSFQVYVLRNELMPTEAFSCGIRFTGEVPFEVNGDCMLARYNSRHNHKNKGDYEPKKIRNECHIHRATARAQQENIDLDHYAKPTDRYADWHKALICLLDDFNVSGVNVEGFTGQLIKP